MTHKLSEGCFASMLPHVIIQMMPLRRHRTPFTKRTIMMNAIAKRSRQSAAGATVEIVLSRTVPSYSLRRNRPFSSSDDSSSDCRNGRRFATSTPADTKARIRGVGHGRSASRKLSSKVEKKLAAADAESNGSGAPAGITTGGDGGGAIGISPAAREAAGLIKRHLEQAKKTGATTLVETDPEILAVQHRRATAVLEAYELTETGGKRPPVGLFDFVPDDFKVEIDEGKRARVVVESTADGVRRRSGTTWVREDNGLASEVASLLVGLHRRVQRRKKYSGISPFSYADPEREAFAYHQRLKDIGYEQPHFLYTTLTEALLSKDLAEEAEIVFQTMIEKRIPPTEACATKMVRSRVERNQLDEATEVVAVLESDDWVAGKPKLRYRSYEPLIQAYMRRGDMEGVMKLWKHMRWHGVLPKESFVIDLMADLARNTDGTSTEDVSSMMDKMIEGVSSKFIHASAPAVSELIEGFGAKLTNVSEEGQCISCGYKLQRVELDPTDRMQLRSSIMRVAAIRSARQLQKLCWFATWLSTLDEMPTAVIDGPNAAYMDQNGTGGVFRFQQVDWVAEHLESLGERVMIIMPHFYCMSHAMHRRPDGEPRRRKNLSESDEMLLKKWDKNKWLVITEGLDDFYWMYTTVAHDDVSTVVLTNDNMRDHRNFFPSSCNFDRWKRGHMVRLAFDWGKLGPLQWSTQWEQQQCEKLRASSHSAQDSAAESELLGAPKVQLVTGTEFSQVQRSGDNWHLPVRQSESGTAAAERKDARGKADHEAVTRWLCVPLPSAASKEVVGSDVERTEKRDVEKPATKICGKAKGTSGTVKKASVPSTCAKSDATRRKPKTAPGRKSKSSSAVAEDTEAALLSAKEIERFEQSKSESPDQDATLAADGDATVEPILTPSVDEEPIVEDGEEAGGTEETTEPESGNVGHSILPGGKAAGAGQPKRPLFF